MTEVTIWPSVVVVGGDARVNMMPGTTGTIPPEMLPDIAIPKVHKVADATARTALLASGSIDGGEWVLQLDDSSWWLFDGELLQQAPVITPGVYALVDHTHDIDDVTGLSAALSGKSDTSHSHTGVYAAASHSHSQSDVTGLASALSGKADLSHGHSASDIAAVGAAEGDVLTVESGIGVWKAPAGGGSALAVYAHEADLPAIGASDVGKLAILTYTGRLMRAAEMSPGVYAWLEINRFQPGGPVSTTASPLAPALDVSSGEWIYLIVLDDVTTAYSVGAPSATLGAGGAEVIFAVINLGSSQGVVGFDASSFWQFWDGSACYTYPAEPGTVTQIRFRLVGETGTGGCSHAICVEPEKWIRESTTPPSSGGGGIQTAEYLADLPEASEEGAIALIPTSGLICKSALNGEMMMTWNVIGLFEPSTLTVDEGAVTDPEFVPNFAIDEAGPDSGRLYYMIDPATMGNATVTVRPPVEISDLADNKVAVFLINNLAGSVDTAVSFVDCTDPMEGTLFRWQDPDGQMYGVNPTVAAGYSLLVKFRLSKSAEGGWTARQIEPSYILASGGGGGGGGVILGFIFAYASDSPPFAEVIPSSGVPFYMPANYANTVADSGGASDANNGLLTQTFASPVITLMSVGIWEPTDIDFSGLSEIVHSFSMLQGGTASLLHSQQDAAWRFRDNSGSPMARSGWRGTHLAISPPSENYACRATGVNPMPTITPISGWVPVLVSAGKAVFHSISSGAASAGETQIAFIGGADRTLLVGWSAVVNGRDFNYAYWIGVGEGMPTAAMATVKLGLGSQQLFGAVGLLKLGPAADPNVGVYAMGVDSQNVEFASVSQWAVDVTDQGAVKHCRTDYAGFPITAHDYATDVLFDNSEYAGSAFNDVGAPATDISVVADGKYLVGYSFAFGATGFPDEYTFALYKSGDLVAGSERAAYNDGASRSSVSGTIILDLLADESVTVRIRCSGSTGYITATAAEFFAVKIG